MRRWALISGEQIVNVVEQPLMAWARDDFRVRRVQFPIEIQARPGFERLLRGFGFHAVHKTAIYNKE